MAKFSVGEVAVLALAYPSERWIDSSWVGREVTVISLPYVNDCFERLYYDVEAPWLPTSRQPKQALVRGGGQSNQAQAAP